MVNRTVLVGAALALFACGDDGGEPCGPAVCAEGLACAPSVEMCVLPARLEACAGLSEGDLCTFPGVAEGLCLGGLCFAPACGDGIVYGNEDCDGDEVGQVTCVDFGFYDAGTVTCSSDCTFDVSSCTGYCGDGIVNGPEVCDSAPPAGNPTCADFNQGTGNVGCSASCGYDFSSCSG